MKLLIASTNVHKLREFREMFKKNKGIELYSLRDFPKYVSPEETGKTFEENAVLKGIHAASELKMLTIADDSGLVVPSLEGRPGVYSRRYSGEDATDQENRTKLLEEMALFHDIQRSAYYECCIALADSSGLKKCVNGRVEGLIAHTEKGSGGFGYDSIFLKHDYDKTFAEVDEATKNRISHRRKAFEKLSLILETLVA
jgi:XTP/dITP diphosphohydrolase